MSPFAFGPIYCEDYIARAGVFPAEPVNFASNGIIVLFGIAAAVLVAKRAPRAFDLYLLAGLLTATGIGSGLWHGLREPWALTLDVMPGLFFLFAAMYCWMRRLSGHFGALLFLGLFYLGFSFSRAYWGVVQRWVALAPVVVGAGIWLVAQTAFRSPRAAVLGALSLVLAMAALAFRTIDLQACAVIPFGTHFLWHILLSASGFTGILALTGLPARGVAPKPALESPAQG